MEPTSTNTQTSPALTPTPAQAQAQHDHFYSRVFALATIALLGFMLYQIIQPFLGTIIWALFLAFLLYPLHMRITRRFKNCDNLSAALLTVITFVMLIGPITALGSIFITQASDLAFWIQGMFEKQTPTFG